MFGRLRIIEETKDGKSRVIHDKANLIVNNAIQLMRKFLVGDDFYPEGINTFAVGLNRFAPVEKTETNLDAPIYAKAVDIESVETPAVDIPEFEKEYIFHGKVTTQEGEDAKFYTTDFKPNDWSVPDYIEILDGPNAGTWTYSASGNDYYEVTSATVVYDELERNARAWDEIVSSAYPWDSIARFQTIFDYGEANDIDYDIGFGEAALAVDYEVIIRIGLTLGMGITWVDGNPRKFKTSDSRNFEDPVYGGGVQPGDLLGVRRFGPFFSDVFTVESVDGIYLYTTEDIGTTGYNDFDYGIAGSSGEIFSIQRFDSYIFKDSTKKFIFDWQIGFTNPGFNE